MFGRQYCNICRGHVADQRCVGVQSASDDTHSHVTVGDDSDQPLSLVDDWQRANILLIHQPRSLAHRHLRCHRPRPLRHHFCNLRSHHRPFRI